MSSTFHREAGPLPEAWRTTAEDRTLDEATTAFGLSAAIVIVFNTVLAWIKDAYEPLNSFMAALSGHHWITHGLLDVILFFVLGYMFMRQHRHMDGYMLAAIVTAAVVVGGGGLALWFVLV